jgi:hypothetical protein
MSWERVYEAALALPTDERRKLLSKLTAAVYEAKSVPALDGVSLRCNMTYDAAPRGAKAMGAEYAIDCLGNRIDPVSVYRYEPSGQCHDAPGVLKRPTTEPVLPQADPSITVPKAD